VGGLLVRNFIDALAVVLNSLLTLYWWVVIIAVLVTWVNPDPRNPIVRFLRSTTEPLFWQVRRWMPFVVIGALDLSPIVVLVGIEFLRMLVVRTLFDLSSQLAAVVPALLRV
jgi:YggT family protein